MSQLPSPQKKVNVSKGLSQPQKGLKIFNNQFIVKKKISSGSFGVVFLGEDKQTNQPVALKIEREEQDDVKSLDREVIGDCWCSQTLLAWAGELLQYHGTLVAWKRSCSLPQNIEKVYSQNSTDDRRIITSNIRANAQSVDSVVHRDLKPENILVGFDDDELTKIYIVDYGISKFFRDGQGNHIPQKDGKPFIGTTRYASINAHKGIELARADDLESIIYILIFLFKGHVSDKDKTKAVGEMKMKIETKFLDFLIILESDLCKDMPVEFARFLDYVKKMQFKQQPDYKHLQQLLRKAGGDMTYDYQYDWVELELKQKQSEKKKEKESSQKLLMKPKIIADDPMTPKSQAPKQQSQLSQIDFLKPPDASRMKKNSNKRKQSISSLANSQYSNCSNMTYQSSVANNYQPSMLACVEEQMNEKNTNFSKNLISFDSEQMVVADDDEKSLKHMYSSLLETQVQAQRIYLFQFQQDNQKFLQA